ncbi:hypothetical protein DXA11_26105, partial [Bacteroides sp. AM56-10ce]
LLVRLLFFILCYYFCMKIVVHEINFECTLCRDVKGKLLKNGFPFLYKKRRVFTRLYCMIYQKL